MENGSKALVGGKRDKKGWELTQSHKNYELEQKYTVYHSCVDHPINEQKRDKGKK
jgi:hypothetical protein